MERKPYSLTILASELFLLFLPAGHLLFFRIGGAVATGADFGLLLLVAAGALDLFYGRGTALASSWADSNGPVPGIPPRRFLTGILILLVYAGWVGLSGLWSFHPRYAIAKGAGVAALVLGAAFLATCGIGWKRAVDAWLGGAALALVLTVVLAFVPGLRQRVVYGGTGVLGLPFPRVSGPFLHPDMLGDYLAVSGVLLWARWPEYSGAARRGAVALATAIAAFLFLTVSTAWVALGVVALLAARSGAVRGPWRPWLRTGGVLLAGLTLVGILVPFDVHVLGLHVVTGAIRPAIWRGSLDAAAHDPLLGVGASPYLARTADPLTGAARALWDAHDVVLSVLGQFGLVGLLLAGAGVWMVVTGSVGGGMAPSRRRLALRLALVVVAVDGVFTASEDMRHLWMLLGMAGVAAAEGGGERDPGPAGRSAEPTAP